MLESTQPPVYRARSSLCLSCGYHLDGLEIAEGSITCPECGMVSRYRLETPSHRPDRSRMLFTSLGIFVLAVSVPMLVVPSTTLLVAVIPCAVVLLWIVPRVLRRFMDL